MGDDTLSIFESHKSVLDSSIDELEGKRNKLMEQLTQPDSMSIGDVIANALITFGSIGIGKLTGGSQGAVAGTKAGLLGSQTLLESLKANRTREDKLTEQQIAQVDRSIQRKEQQQGSLLAKELELANAGARARATAEENRSAYGPGGYRRQFAEYQQSLKPEPQPRAVSQGDTPATQMEIDLARGVLAQASNTTIDKIQIENPDGPVTRGMLDQLMSSAKMQSEMNERPGGGQEPLKPKAKAFIAKQVGTDEETVGELYDAFGKNSPAALYATGANRADLPPRVTEKLNTAENMRQKYTSLIERLGKYDDPNSPLSASGYFELARRIPASEADLLKQDMEFIALSVATDLQGAQVNGKELQAVKDYLSGSTAVGTGEAIKRIEKMINYAENTALGEVNAYRRQGGKHKLAADALLDTSILKPRTFDPVTGENVAEPMKTLSNGTTVPQSVYDAARQRVLSRMSGP